MNGLIHTYRLTVEFYIAEKDLAYAGFKYTAICRLVPKGVTKLYLCFIWYTLHRQPFNKADIRLQKQLHDLLATVLEKVYVYLKKNNKSSIAEPSMYKAANPDYRLYEMHLIFCLLL